jgi:uncharacterized protein
MSLSSLLLVNAVVFFGALLQGSVGFGLGLVSAPLLVLIHPPFIPGPQIGAALVLVLLMAARERQGIDVGALKWAVPGRFVGAWIGAAALSALPAGALELVFGAVILFAVLLSASRLHLRPNPPTLMGAGVVSGITGTIVSIGGPPVALVYQRASGEELRSTLSGYFVFGCVFSLVALAALGRYGLAEIRLSLILLPGLILGYLASSWTVGKFDRGHTRAAVLLVSGSAAVVAILRALL